MGDPTRGPVPDHPRFDPRETPVPRRRVLLAMGAGALAAGGGVGAILGACSSPPVRVTVDVDPATLVVGTPTEVPFTLTIGDDAVEASAWLVRTAAGEVIAFDPRCTHAVCAYDWSEDARRFKCQCHDGSFALDGTVLAGPPPRPLDRFPARVIGDVIELDVPASFVTPKESL